MNSRKRRRFNTGSVNVAHFQTLSNDDKLAMLFGKLIDIEEKLPSFQKLQNTVDEIKGKAVITEKSINWHEQQIKTLNYKSVDLEARSRRRNLIFRGLYESRSEDCTDIIKQFFYDKLQLNPSEILIERAHRLGKRTRLQFSKRPIIAAFNSYVDTVQILGKAYLLKGSQFSIDRDYPAEILNARKQLWPRFKELKQTKRVRDTITIRYPAQLVKNREVIEDALPEWTDMMRKSRISNVVNTNKNAQPQTSNYQGSYKNQSSRQRQYESWAIPSKSDVADGAGRWIAGTELEDADFDNSSKCDSVDRSKRHVEMRRQSLRPEENEVDIQPRHERNPSDRNASERQSLSGRQVTSDNQRQSNERHHDTLCKTSSHKQSEYAHRVVGQSQSKNAHQSESNVQSQSDYVEPDNNHQSTSQLQSVRQDQSKYNRQSDEQRTSEKKHQLIEKSKVGFGVQSNKSLNSNIQHQDDIQRQSKRSNTVSPQRQTEDLSQRQRQCSSGDMSATRVEANRRCSPSI